MRKTLSLLMLFVCSNAWGAPQPKAPGTNLLDSVSAIQPVGDPDEGGSSRLPALTQDNVPGHLITADGSTVLLLRFARPGAAAIRLHIEDLHLPQGASLFIYTLDNSGQIVSQDTPSGNVSDYWTPALTGDTAVVEVDWQNDIPGDIPFRVTELRASEPSTDSPAVSSKETFKATYRGQEFTYTVVDGLAVTEGDIVLGRHGEVGGSGKDSAQHRGVGITGSYYRWPNGVIPYSIPSGFPNSQRILDAVDHWNTMLNGVIRFVPRTNQSNYVTFLISGGCSAMVGMNGIGAQPVYLADACSTGNVIHELGHAVGLWHEQSREDRDRYVKILWQNVDPSMLFNFNQNIYNGDDLGSYDFNSIMHYPTYSFSLNGQPTIETIPAGIPIGQRNGLSAGDVAAVRSMYGASATYVAPAPTPAPAPAPAPPPAPVPVPVLANVTVSLQTNPAGQTIRIDGVNTTAPALVTWVVGSSHTIEAVNPNPAGAILSFIRWSDGGNQAHTVVAASNVTVINADYSVSYSVSTSTFPNGTGTVTVSPQSANGLYAANTSLTFTATPATGYCFSSWSGLLGSTPASTSISVNSPMNVTANFVPGGVTIGAQMLSVSAAGGTTYVPVNSNGYCGWTASSFTSWATISSGARGAGSGNVALSIAPNTTGYARSALLQIGGKVVIVSQSSH